MRKHRVALMFAAAFGAALVLVASTGALAPQHQQETSYKWSSIPKPHIPQRTMLLTAQDLAPLATFAADVQRAQEVTALSQLAAASSSSTASSGAMSPATTLTPTAPPSSGVDLLLADAPAYVVQAFNCIADDHESGGNPVAINPSSGDSGLYQFAVGTWQANGGGQFAPQAYEAPVWAQDTVAYWTWEHDGFSPWDGDNECWG